jgi:cytochrome d ubiquinol oxidase subunit II
MQLHTIWFLIVTFLWIGFFVLEGFDFGVGVLHRWIGKSEEGRRVAITTVGMWWDGNEVWLIVAGGAMFAAFPAWYAAMFSALYLALVIVIVAIFGRDVSFEWRSKRESARWRGAWSWVLTIGSILMPLLLGVALGDLLNGLPINAQHNFTGNFLDLLTGYGLMTGVTLLTLCLLHGCTFLSLRTTDDVQRRAHAFGRVIGPVAVVINLAWVIWTLVVIGGGTVPQPTQIFGMIAVIFAAVLLDTNNDGWAFFASGFAIAAAIAQIFIALYPTVMVSSTNHAYNLTVNNASAGHYPLFVMTLVAAIFFPIVLLYQGWSFRVFRGRVMPGRPKPGTPPQPRFSRDAPASPSPAGGGVGARGPGMAGGGSGAAPG